MKILGIDTAMRSTGYGILSVEENTFTAIDCGTIKTPQKSPHSECLRRLAGGIRELINNYEVAAASVEGAFYGKNIKTTMILGYARGSVMTVLAEASIPIFAYSPKEVKQSATGSGNSSKQQISVVLSSLLDLEFDQLEDDASDALGLAFCHANRIINSSTNFMKPKPI